MLKRSNPTLDETDLASSNTDDLATEARPPPVAMFDLNWILGILRQQWRTILVTLTVFFLLGLLQVIFAKRYYTATGSIVFDLRQPNVLSNNPILQSLGSDQYIIESQVELIKSRKIARKVIEGLGLAPGLNGTHKSQSDMLFPVSGHVSQPEAPASSAEEVDRQTHQRLSAETETGGITEQTYDHFLRNLTASRQGLSFVIDISYSDTDPKRSAQICNSVMRAYLEEQTSVKISTIRAANDWLAARVEELKKQVLDAETKVQNYKVQNNIIESEQSALNLQEFAEYTKQIAEARAALAQAKARLNQINQFMQTPEQLDSVPEVLQSRVIADLRTQYAQISRKQGLLTSRFGQDNPQVADADTELARITEQIKVEIARIAKGEQVNYEIAQNRVKVLEDGLVELKSNINANSQKALGLAELDREAKVVNTIYANFLTRLRETQAQETLQVPDARVVSPAVAPLSPSRPIKSLTLAFALAFGTSLGFLLAFVRHSLDPLLHHINDVKRATSIPIIAALPNIADSNDALRQASEDALQGENSLYLQNIFLLKGALRNPRSHGQGTIAAILSPRAAEGKTTVALALTRYLAKAGFKTLLIDADFQHARATEEIAPTYSGMTLLDLYQGKVQFQNLLIKDPRSNLMVLPATIRAASSTARMEIFASQTFAALLSTARHQYDFVVFDAPGVLDTVEARTLASLVDNTVIIAELDKTQQAELVDSIDIIDRTGGHLVGLVVNRNKPPVRNFLLHKLAELFRMDKNTITSRILPGRIVQDR